MSEHLLPEKRREVTSMEEAILGDLKLLLATNFLDFQRLVDSARNPNPIEGRFVGTPQYRLVEDLHTLGLHIPRPEVIDVVKKYVVGEGIEMRIEIPIDPKLTIGKLLLPELCFLFRVHPQDFVALVRAARENDAISSKHAIFERSILTKKFAGNFQVTEEAKDLIRRYVEGDGIDMRIMDPNET